MKCSECGPTSFRQLGMSSNALTSLASLTRCKQRDRERKRERERERERERMGEKESEKEGDM
jgi:hypothetical protein